jgi:hypothetical protein
MEAFGGDLQVRVYHNNISGNEALSFKTQGLNYSSEINFGYNDRWGADDEVRVQGLANFQLSDDPRYQIRDDTIRLQNAYITANRPDHWMARAGYFSENFSSYTFSSSLLGLNGSYSLTDGLTLRLLAGRDHRARAGQQYARYSGGWRTEWAPTKENYEFGLSYVQTRDHVNSLQEAERSNVSDTISNEVWGIDYQHRFDYLNSRLEAEWARSNFDTDVTSDAGQREGDNALNIGIQLRPGAIGNVTMDFEEVDPGFESSAGFATSDRRRYRLGWDRSFTPLFSMRGDYERWEDGLESTRENRVKDWSLEAAYGFGFESFWRPALEASVQNRVNDGFENSSINESDRETYRLSMNNRLGASDVNFEYSLQDRKSDSETRGQLGFDLRAPLELGGYSFTYYLDSQYEELENDLGVQSEIDRRLRYENRLVLAEGEQESIELKQGYQESDGANSRPIVRESGGVSYRYMINRQTGDEISVSYNFTDNEDKGNSDQNYREETFEMNVGLTF